MPLSRRETNALAARFRALRPQAGVDNACRRVWANMVNAVTGAGAVPEAQLRDFREAAGWESKFDRSPLEGKR